MEKKEGRIVAMGKECGRCKLIMAMQKMSRDASIKVDQIVRKDILTRFLAGKSTFKEVGIALGLSNNSINNYLSAEYQDRYIDG
jgi:hypothetical protein